MNASQTVACTIIARAGFGSCPADSIPEVKAVASYVTKSKGDEESGIYVQKNWAEKFH